MRTWRLRFLCLRREPAIFTADGGPDSGHHPGIARDIRRVGGCDKLTQRPGTSSVAALVLARVAQRRAAENADLDGLVEAIEYENRALAAIKLHLPELPAKKPRQLRLPGL
jgi:hypothetical protein